MGRRFGKRVDTRVSRSGERGGRGGGQSGSEGDSKKSAIRGLGPEADKERKEDKAENSLSDRNEKPQEKGFLNSLFRVMKILVYKMALCKKSTIINFCQCKREWDPLSSR